MRLYFSQLLVFGALSLTTHASVAEDAVVLVSSSNSPIENLSSLEIRKAYLGISVTIVGHPVRPLRRGDDERIENIFLQSVMAMSHRSYERRLLSLALKFGMPRPLEVDDREELITLLVGNPYSISYMWQSDAESDVRVKTIKVLWQER